MFRINSDTTARDYNSIPQQVLNASFIGSSLDSDYIPFYAMFSNSEHKIIGDFRYTTYWIPPPNLYTSTRAILAFKNAMEVYTTPVSHTRGEITYYCVKGMIYVITDNKPVILFSLIVHKDYWRQITRFDQLDYSKFLCVIATEFAKPEYLSMYKYFKKFILEPLDKPIDIVYTNDITRYSFKPVEIPVQFPTIVAMKDYFLEISNLTLDELARNTG